MRVTLKKSGAALSARPGFNSGIDLELDLIPSLIPGIGMGMGINF